MCAFHLSHALLLVYVPVMGAEKIQFPCRVIIGDYCSNSQTFLLTAKLSTKKKSCCYGLQGQKSLARTPPQELEVGPRSVPYLLVTQ